MSSVAQPAVPVAPGADPAETTTTSGTATRRPGPASEPAAPVRASDAEREEMVARLHHALGEGRLDLAETDERVAAAYAARYRSELPPLLADLDDPGYLPAGAGTGAPTWSAIWVTVVWRARTALWGPTGPGGARPTAGHCRTAARLVVVAVLWVLVCAFLGAALVSA